MAETWSPDTIVRALGDVLTTVASERLHGPVTADAGATPAGSGWSVEFVLSGRAAGAITLWLEDAVVAALENSGADPKTTGDALVRGFASELGAGLASLPIFARVNLEVVAEPIASQPMAIPDGAFTLNAVDKPIGVVAVSARAVDTRPTKTGDRRLEAVLDVELPLIVRFGRTVMPLRALSELGPGSVIDMNRAPDEPVDLMVGERLIARGEVVIVSGNYGVRITELLGGREATPELEARPS
jgi:flagellar motor switch protein FliN/FliY